MKHVISKLRKNEVFMVAGLGLLVVAVRFLPFFWNKTLFYGDNYSLLVPGKLYSAEWIKQGIVPLWNPYILSGISWVGDISQSLFYPTTLLFLVFETADALNLSVIFSLWWTWLGMYVLARRLGAGLWGSLVATILWTFSTVVTGSINNLATLQSIIFFPWIAWAPLSSKKLGVVVLASSVLIAGQVIAGYPQHVILSVFFAILLSLIVLRPELSMKRIISQWMLALLLTLGLSAFVWLPFVETLLASTRMSQSVEQAQTGSLTPAMMVKIILPYFYDMPALGIRWGAAWSGQPNVFMYFSWAGLMGLGLILRRRVHWEKLDLFLSLVALVSLLLAFGNLIPGYGLAQKILPFLRVSRYPSLTLIITTLCSILLLSRLKQSSWREFNLQKFINGGIIILIIGLAGLVVWLLWPAATWNWLDALTRQKLSTSAFHTLTKDVLIVRMILVNLVVNSAFFVLFIWAHKNKRIWFSVAVLMIDMFVNTQGLFMYANEAIYPQGNQTNAPIRVLIDGYANNTHRMLTRNFNQPYTDFGMYWEAQTVQQPFSDSFITKEERERRSVLMRLQEGGTPNWNTVFGWPMVHGYTTLLPLDYTNMFTNKNEEIRINYLPNIDIEAAILDEWAVKYYIVDEWFEIKESLAGLVPLAEANGVRIYERPNALPRVRWLEGEGELSIMAENPNEVALHVEAHEPGTLLMADRYESGWKAYLNEQTLELNSFAGMRALDVPKGSYIVQLRYEPLLLRIGLMVSGTSLLVGLIGALQYTYERKNRSRPR